MGSIRLDVMDGHEHNRFSLCPFALDHREFKWQVEVIRSPVELGEGEGGIAMAISQGCHFEILVKMTVRCEARDPV